MLGFFGRVCPFLWLLHITQSLFVCLLFSSFLCRLHLVLLVIASPYISAFGYTMVSFILTSAHKPQDGVNTGAHKVSQWKLLHTFMWEVSCFFGMFNVILPFGGLFLPGSRKLPTRSVARQLDAFSPVLFIPGYLCAGALWWPIISFLKSRGLQDLCVVDLAPFCGSIHDFVEQVDKSVRDILATTGQHKVVLVGASMGGVVARDVCAAV